MKDAPTSEPRGRTEAGIVSIATANPDLYVRQEEAFRFFDARFELSADQRELYRRLLLDGPIRGRHIAMERYDEALETDPDRLLARFGRYACPIAAAAARRALEEAGVAPRDVAGIIVNTCTGYLCPGLSSYLAEALGLAEHVRARDLMGMGCGAAIPNLEYAAGMIATGADGPVLSVAVEICSATFFMDDDPGLTVSNAIFGDGAAAAVVVPAAGRPPRLRLLDFESGLFPQHREQLRYRTEGGRLRNVLGKRVPIIGATTAGSVLERLLARHGLGRQQMPWWAVHAGGTAVLDRIGEGLGLVDEQLRFSQAVFREYGNMSSPTVLFALKKILDEGRPRAGDRGVLLAFGAGFSAFAALVEFC